MAYAFAPLIPTTKKQGQADLCAFKANLVHSVSSKPVRDIL